MKIFKNIFPALAVAAALVVAAPVTAQTQWFSAELSGAEAVGSPGDSDGWGVGVIGVDDDTVHYYLWPISPSPPRATSTPDRPARTVASRSTSRPRFPTPAAARGWPSDR